MVKRDLVGITSEILDFCSKPQTKMQLMYRTNLSWRTLQHYLSQLQSLDLLEVHGESTVSHHEEGQEFLEKWRELKDW